MLREQMEAADAFLVGRKTFEQMRAYWPKRMFLYTAVLGRGRRLFTDARFPWLQLVETRPFRSGIVLLRYRMR